MIFEVVQVQKLDEIVFTHYETLVHYNEVLDANPHLVHKVVLEPGDKIELPVFEDSANEIQIKALWD